MTDKKSIGEGSPPAEKALPPSEKQFLITVHGTGAGDESIEGDRWWQLGSRFQTELKERLHLAPRKVEIEPFQWAEGRNSEIQRRVAAQDLLNRLYELEASGHDYYLIGHSHGGSVIYNALLLSLRNDRPLKRLRQWCTVGTPFLDYRKNRWIWQRLRGGWLTFWALTLLLLITVVSFYVRDWYDGYTFENIEHVRTYNHILSVIAGLMLIVVWANSTDTELEVEEDLKIATCFDKSEKKAVAPCYGAAWSGFWHKDDEAISALVNVRKVSMPFIAPEYLMRGFAVIPLGLVLFFGILLAFNTVAGGDWLIQFLIGWAEADEAGTQEASGFWLGLVVALILLFISAVILRVVYVVLLKPMGRLFRSPSSLIASIMNKAIRNNIRYSAWGDDLVPEDVYGVSAHPPHFEQAFSPLPDIISDPLSTHSEKNAIETLRKVRQVLGTSDPQGASSDLRAHLSDSLSWQELIHTSYFDVPEFVDLMALTLHRAGLGELRHGFVTFGSERAILEDWSARQPVPYVQKVDGDQVEHAA